MNVVKVLMKVGVQDILIIAGFLVVSCGIGKLGSMIGDGPAFIVFGVTWPVLFLLLFFSNAELVKSINNAYIWALSSAIPTVILTTGAVMYAAHNSCKVPFIGLNA